MQYAGPPLQASTLALRVAEVNRVNKVANELSERLIDYFQQFVGEKVVKVDGNLLVKVAPGVVDIISQLEAKYGNHSGWPHLVTREHSDYSLVWNVNACTSDGNGRQYGRPSDGVAVYIGRLDGQTLVELHHPFKERADWTAEEVMQGRAVLEAAKKAARDAEAALGPFATE